MRFKLYAGAAVAALIVPGAAFAQSTGSVDFDESADIVVIGSAKPDTGGLDTPDTPKAKAVLTQDFISHRTPGQSILDTINLVPGVSFTNTDAYGSSGGNLRIRGFDGNRISLTFDGVPLNDSGNYAIYSNQQLDSELIEQVNVNFGATDVDAPTASASGGTVNYRSLVPSDKMGATVVYSHGTSNQNRIFGLFQTGVFTSFGTKAWFSASEQRYDIFRGPGEIFKQQYNGKLYQPIGSNGDFISIAGHYNQNRNNFYSSPNVSTIRSVTPGFPANSAITPANPYTIDLNDTEFSNLFATTTYDNFCTLNSVPGGTGSQNDRSVCSNYYGTAINPSNTGNIRFNSRFTLSDSLVLTIDAAYQYVKANGGGSQIWAESDANGNASGVYSNQDSRIGAGIAAGVDINHDGDMSDYVRILFPSNTRTQRLTSVASLRYDLDPSNTLRLAYTWDRARHRQTGEGGLLQSDGNPYSPFGGLNADGQPVLDAAGNVLQKRDRLSYAILHQISGEYRGRFFDNALQVSLGVRAPFFRRNLNNYCWTIPGSSNDAYCTSESDTSVAASHPTYGAPYTHRIKTYSAVLPNVGLTYKFGSAVSAFASYAKGFSAPRTDNLYGFDDVTIKPTDEVKPEKTDSFDLGLRYTTRLVQAQLAGWYIHYNNRIISSLVELEGGGTLNVDRNVGATETKGIDFSLNVRPAKWLYMYGYVSYIDSELKQDAINPLTGAILAATKGKFVVETPEWQYGGRVNIKFDPFSLGIQAKHTGDRWVTDVNDLKASGYTLVDLDARVKLSMINLPKTYLQLNIYNLFDENYFGNLSTNTSVSSNPRLSIGAPRTFVGSIHFEF